jgi:RND family efflux transporter MFP subunit
MRQRPFLLVGLIFCAIIGCESAGPPAVQQGEATPAARQNDLEATGRSQCVPGKRAIIAPVPLHPVVEVMVKPGDRVKKEQKLVKLDDDEPQADVRGKKAALESATITLKESRRYLAAIDPHYKSGALPEQLYHTAMLNVLKAEQDERAAKAGVESSEAELEHYTVVAPIDGVIAWLDVYLGMVSRPGTTVWGEILDLSEIDVRCELPAEEVDRVAVGQAAEVWLKGAKKALGAGTVAFVGIAGDKRTGLVPVLVRLANEDGRLRCDVSVHVRFTGAKPAEGAR